MCIKSHFDNLTAHKDLACGAPPSVSFGLIIFCVTDLSSSLSAVFHHRKVGAQASDDWRVCSDGRVQRWNHSGLQFTGAFMLASISAHVLAFQCLFLDCFNPFGVTERLAQHVDEGGIHPSMSCQLITGSCLSFWGLGILLKGISAVLWRLPGPTLTRTRVSSSVHTGDWQC